MSWLVSVTNCPREDVEERLLAAKGDQGQPEAWSDHAEAQFAAGLEALQVLLDSVEGDTVNVNVSGHAKGTYEGDNDTVNVNVSGVLLPPDEPPAPVDDAEVVA